MKLFYLILLVMLMEVIGEQHQYDNTTSDQLPNKSRYKRMLDIEPLILKVKINGKSKTIHLEPVNHFLANENLPVWISAEGEFTKLHNIMERDVGDFTMYRDYSTRSAVVYFHKRRELDGIIKAEYKIKGISIDEMNEEHRLGSQSFLNLRRYFRRPPKSNDNPERCQRPALKVYPELLLAISHDMVNAIEERSTFEPYVKTIYHMLTVYNIVDMMYRFVRSVDIFINIAGIVIEGVKNEWGLLSRHSSDVDGDSVNDRINEYFQSTGGSIRQHSYDYIAYHTRARITGFPFPLHGVSCCEHSEPMRTKFYYQHNLAVRDWESYKHYSTIAHELAHIFGAEHDGIFNSYTTHPCDRSAMATCGYPNLCLKWSDKTERDLEKFFSSAARCMLLNEPQSLLPDYPRTILTGLQQCKCYGYSKFSLHKDQDTNDGGCSSYIGCGRNDYLGWLSVYPMDGTPCDHRLNKVCWNKRCVDTPEN